MAAYEKAVQSAFQDVSNALVARETLQQQYDARVQTQKAYNDRLRLINLRYRHGVSSSLEVLDAERSSYSADAAVLATQLSMLENLADLYKALGGGLRKILCCSAWDRRANRGRISSLRRSVDLRKASAASRISRSPGRNTKISPSPCRANSSAASTLRDRKSVV